MSDSFEEPGPPPRRQLTPAGRWFVGLAIIMAAALLLILLVMVPSRFGVSPG